MSAMLIIATILGGCEITPPDNSSETAMNLVFTRDNELWTYDLLGDHFKKVVPQGAVIYVNEMGTEFTRIWADGAQWSPDGKKIVFIEAVGTDGGNLKILNVETGKEKFFNYKIARDDISPSWNADGTEIFFAKMMYNPGRNYELFKVDTSGENEHQIISHPRYLDYYPTFSSSNNTIVYAGEDHLSILQLFQVNIDGSNPIQLTHGVLQFYEMFTCPQFNPVNDDLVYVATSGDSSYKDIWLVHDLDFTNALQLTDSDSTDWAPSWSNDGKYIVFTRYEDPFQAFSNPTVWIMNADGRDQRKLLDNGSNSDLWCENLWLIQGVGK